MTNLSSGLLVLVLLSSTSAAAQSSMELADVVKVFLPPASAEYNMYDWSEGSGASIKWKTKGIAEAPQYLQKDGFSYVRQGVVTATIGGKPTHMVLGKKLAPGTWIVSMRGARGGYTSVEIRTDVNTEGLGQGILRDRLAKQISAKAVRCTSPAASSGNTVYEVQVPDKKPVWINEDWSCGSAGCSSGLTLLFSKADADKVACE